jgi:hypothetical protein
MQCARHPQVETFVRCGKCERPICPDCMVSGPVGVRCKDCGRQNLDAIMRGSPQQYLLASACAFGSALLLGWLSHVLVFWLGSVYGYIVGEATLRGGGRKRGLAMQVIAGAAAATGSFVWAAWFGRVPLMFLLHAGTLGRTGLGPSLLAHFLDPFALIGLGLGVFFAVVHVRYI